ncbi:MAG: FHA domain-containing protein [Thermodesulfobacteriota bacterium]
MPYLIRKIDSKLQDKTKLSAAGKLRVGRDAENDIVVDDSAVSAVHAEIEAEDDRFYLTDYNSRNGTFVNRELVISRPLAHGDIITIGAHEFVFAYARDEKRPEAAAAVSHQATMHIDTPDHRCRLARSVAELVEKPAQAKSQGMLEFLNEKRDPVALTRSPVHIGKDGASDIVARGLFVGKTAARIEKRTDGYYLTPVSGKPPRVNYQPVKSDVRLNEFDIIEIGATTLQFYYQTAAAVPGDGQASP